MLNSVKNRDVHLDIFTKEKLSRIKIHNTRI